MPNSSVEVVKLLQALGDRTRLRLLNLLRAGELCVCYFVAVLEAPQPKISRHLAYLRRAGVVGARRDGKWMHYRLERPGNPAAATILDAVLDSVRNDRQMQRDLSFLQRACCATKVAAIPENAPKPQLAIPG